MSAEAAGLGFRFFAIWAAVFLAFPAAGLAAQWATGGVTDAGRALIGGAIVGAVLGLAQFAVLRTVLPVNWTWVATTALALAMGQGVATLGLGVEMGGSALLARGLLAGVFMATAQAALLLSVGPVRPDLGGAVAVGWPLGWWVTRSAGVDLAPHWAVFGATGALVFQALTGGALLVGLRVLSAWR